MLERARKSFLLIASVTLMSSAFIPLSKPNPPRSLLLLGTGLVILATLTRRHYADEE